MKIRHMLLTLLFLLPVSTSLYGAEVVEQVGVATPQSQAEEGNIEILRKRAIRNATELAVTRVAGALISEEKGDTAHFIEVIKQKDDKFSVATKQKSRFRRSGVSQTTGYVRLVEIVKEWQVGQQYWVKIKVEVGDQKKTAEKMNAGFYWERAGKPEIALAFAEKTRGATASEDDNYTLRYLRDNLVKNGVNVSSKKGATVQYVVKIIQSFQTRIVAEYGTYATFCQLTFQIIAKNSGDSVAEYRGKHGPQAGFSKDQSEGSCIKKIAPHVSENLVRKIAAIMNDRWNKGVEYQLAISGLPGEVVTEASDALKNLFQVSSSMAISYKNKVLQVRLKYRGEGVDLVEAVRLSFDALEWKVVPKTIQGSDVQLRWVQVKTETF